RELTDFECGEIVGLSKDGISQRNITKIVDIPKFTVGKVIKKYNKVGLTTTASCSGRPKVLSEHDSRYLVKIAKENRSNTFEEITDNFNTSIAISVSTRTQVGVFPTFCLSLLAEIISSVSSKVKSYEFSFIVK
ncbi:19852_t:CDS:2, partial [Funneliformis geosporum]